MGCAASRPDAGELLPVPPHPQLFGGISVSAAPAQTSVLLHDFDIVPLSADTYGIDMHPGNFSSTKRFVTASGDGGSVASVEDKDSMEHMLQVLDSLGIGSNGESNPAHAKRSDQASSILEDLKPGLERHFNQALGKTLRGMLSSSSSDKENAVPVDSSPVMEARDLSAMTKGFSSPRSAVKSSKGSTSPGALVKSAKKNSSFASRFLNRSSSSLRAHRHSCDSEKLNVDDDASTQATLESNGSLLFDADFLSSYETALKELTSENWNSSTDVANLVQQNDSKSRKEEEETAQLPVKPQQVPRKRSDPLAKFEKLCPPGGENCVVLYTTSLRGIRKTFEDCNRVRGLLESFQICVDERDVAMHQGFRNELREMMGSKAASVPRLFIKGCYIGGADDVLQLHEEEEFAPLLEGLPQDRRGSANPCDGCGGARFVPCLECSGGRKVVDPENPREVIRCPDCNENGLIQCPICS